MVEWVVELIVVIVDNVVVDVVKLIVHWEFFYHWSIILVVWPLVVIWSWSYSGWSCCEGVALERIQLGVHIGKVPLLVDHLAWGGWGW